MEENSTLIILGERSNESLMYSNCLVNRKSYVQLLKSSIDIGKILRGNLVSGAA